MLWTVTTFLLQAAIVLLGAWVTLWPPPAGRQRWQHLTAFLGLSVLALAATVMQQRDASAQQNKLQSYIEQLTRSTGAIETQTKQPPNISVNVPSPVVQFTPPAPQLPKPSAPGNIRLIELGTTEIGVSATRVSVDEQKHELTVFIEIPNSGLRPGEGAVSVQVGFGSPVVFGPVGDSAKSHMAIGFEPNRTSSLEIVFRDGKNFSWENLSGPLELRLEIIYDKTSRDRMRYVYRGRYKPGDAKLTVLEVSNKPA